MSLEIKIAELTAAVVALTVQMQGQPATVASPVAVTPPVPPVAAPVALPNGMPGGPFGNPSVAVVVPTFTPPIAAGAPFSDLAGCTKYAMEAYGALEAKAPGRGEVVTQVITHLCNSPSINDLPTTAYLAFYTELEKQKAA